MVTCILCKNRYNEGKNWACPRCNYPRFTLHKNFMPPKDVLIQRADELPETICCIICKTQYKDSEESCPKCMYPVFSVCNNKMKTVHAVKTFKKEAGLPVEEHWLEPKHSPNEENSSLVIVRLKTQKMYRRIVPLTMIGRSKRKCNLSFEDAVTITSHHADLVKKDGRTYLKANKTKNGTFLNGVEMKIEEEKEIMDYAEIYLSKSEEFFVAVGGYAEAILEKSILSYLQSVETGEKLYLFCKEQMLGTNFPWVSGAMKDSLIREEHALIGYENGRDYMIDKSKNGTLINGKRIRPNKKRFLENGDKIQLGNAHFNYKSMTLQDGYE